MNTLKVKNILFSLLAIMAVTVFMTSCEQTFEQVEPTMDDTATFLTLLDAAEDKATINDSGNYEIYVNAADIKPEILDTKEYLVLNEDFDIPQNVAEEILCLSDTGCSDMIYTVNKGEYITVSNDVFRADCVTITVTVTVTDRNGNRVTIVIEMTICNQE